MRSAENLEDYLHVGLFVNVFVCFLCFSIESEILFANILWLFVSACEECHHLCVCSLDISISHSQCQSLTLSVTLTLSLEARGLSLAGQMALRKGQ